MIYLMQKEPILTQREATMIRMALRLREPGISLPFLPRSTGINIFPGAGPAENLPPIAAVEVCTVAKGVCDIEQRGRMVRLKAGESLYKLPGEHRKKTVISPEGAMVYWATFDGENAEKFMTSFDYPTGALHTGECPITLYNELFRLFNFSTDDALRRAVAICVDLLVLLPGEAETGNRNAEELLFSEAMLKIRKNFGSPAFNVDALAEILNIHRTTLLRLFKRKTGASPQEIIMRHRLQYALGLLKETQVSVRDVAESSGFARSNYFARVIRRHCGMTPEEYRKHSHDNSPA